MNNNIYNYNNNNNINNINNNNNNNNNNDILFFKIFRNKILFNIIIKFLKYYNKIYDNYHNRRYFKDIDSFNKAIYEKNELNSIVIMGTPIKNKAELYQFIENLPTNIQSIEFKDSTNFFAHHHHYNLDINFEINGLILPKSLKQIKFGNIVFSKEGGSFFSKVFKFKNPFKNLVSLEIGYNCNLMIDSKYLSNSTNLKHLTIRSSIEKPLDINILPVNLKSLDLSFDYIHSTISLPSSLKKLSLGYKHGFYFINPDILQYLPTSVTSLSLLFALKSPIPSIKYSCINLKKLVTTLYFYNNCILVDNGGNNGDHTKNRLPSTLKSLELYFSQCDFRNDRILDIDLLPKSITSLKLSNQLQLKNEKTGLGFPSNITSFQGDHYYTLEKFENPLNLLEILLIDYKDQLNRDGTIKNIFQKFPNLISIKYLECTKPLVNLQISNNLLNLEIISDYLITNYFNSYNFNLPQYGQNNQNNQINNNNRRLSLKGHYKLDLDQPNLKSDSTYTSHCLYETNESPTTTTTITTTTTTNEDYYKLDLDQSNLKSLKLDSTYTSYFLYKINKSSTTPFPPKLELLDLQFDDCPTNLKKSLLSNETLPSTIKFLIIRGNQIPTYQLPLPSSIEHIYISKMNPIVKDLIFMNHYYSISSIFEFSSDINTKSTSKLYSRLKKFIE